MARILAVEWDHHEARAVVGNVRSGEVSIEAAFSVPLEGESSDAHDVARTLGKALAERGLTKLDTITALGRNAVELRVLTLPPATPEDLPDMVRFQAQREFTSLSADSSLDFVQLARSDSDVTVLAAAVPRSTIQQVEQICKEWDGNPVHVVLRPFAAASLWTRTHADASDQTVMLIDVVETDADLTVLVDGRVTFLRTVRLPQQADESGKARALLGEVRRTMVAARGQTGGRRVDRVVWIGAPGDGQEIVSSLGESLEQPVEAFEPFGAVSVGRKLQRDLPASPGHFAPLLGALLDQAHDATHAIDFLHPRKRPAPPDARRKRFGYAIAAAAVLLLIGGLVFARLRMLDARIDELQADLQSRRPILEKSGKLIERLEQLDDFSRHDVTWLDEFAVASQRIPPADDVIFNSLSVAVYKDPGGRMFLKGHVRSSDTIRQLEDSLRFGNNDVNGRRGVYDPSRSDYHWAFDVTVQVPGDVVRAGRSLGRPHLQDQRRESAPRKATGATETVANAPSGKSPSGEPSDQGVGTPTTSVGHQSTTESTPRQ